MPPTNCGDSKFPCYNGECIYGSDVCDGIINCSDDSDEDYCNSTGTVGSFIALVFFYQNDCIYILRNIKYKLY